MKCSKSRSGRNPQRPGKREKTCGRSVANREADAIRSLNRISFTGRDSVANREADAIRSKQ